MKVQTRSNLHQAVSKGPLLGFTILCGLSLLAAALLVVRGGSEVARADPINPPEGYPKLDLSIKTVTPTLANVGGATLDYVIEIRNTGAYAAEGATLIDAIPDNTTYKLGSADATVGTPVVAGGTLTWVGDVGFDSTVVVSFSVDVAAGFSGQVRNTAVINHPLIARPITVTAETVVSNKPVLAIAKTAVPAKPGANKPLTYTLVVSNQGQPATNLTLIVTDSVPSNTTIRSVGADGIPSGDKVIWTRPVTLAFGETTIFTFSVDIGNVPSGTVITNDSYRVTGPPATPAAGEIYTVTVIDPIFRLSKYPWPDPPGSNREMTYTLTLLNVGSLATTLVVTDRVPSGVEYRRGGTPTGDVIAWSLPSLDTGESAEFTYTVYVGDVMNVPVVNDDYAVCSAEGVCQPGKVLTSIVQGPIFETFATVIPIAKKPGGEEVTPTLSVHNVGHGNAIAATIVLTYYRMSLTDEDVIAYLPDGTTVPLDRGPDCGNKCRTFPWTGDIAHDEWVTFTVPPGISTIGGSEGNLYIATIIVTDSLSNMTTPTSTAQAMGKITHYASVVPYKEAQEVIGRGQLLTYTIRVANHGFTTELPPVLSDTVPMSTTFVQASAGGTTQAISDTVVISWVLPLLGPGDEEIHTFTVRVDEDLISGTQIINNDYSVLGYGNIATGTLSSGLPVTTTVQEIGLIDSYKEVSPTIVLPGPGNVLTYYLHIVNSSALDLTGVTVYDLLPWESSTYQRDAVASAGSVVSDIVSVRWTGDVAAFSSEIVTLTVEVDPDFQGVLTNTATINHPELLSEVEVSAVAYVTEKPVLHIAKSASPDPVAKDGELAYTIHVLNTGQQATDLLITDTVPSNTEYVLGSATAGGQWVGGQVRWEIPVLGPGESRTFEFRVTVGSGSEVINDQYVVRCAEGVVGVGAPLVTPISRAGAGDLYLPIVLKNAQ
jgi:uncharacterized repeat protein (TIGR01451 family)